MIAYLSDFFELARSDLILSGTLAGVAALKHGDKLHGHADGIDSLDLKVT